MNFANRRARRAFKSLLKSGRDAPVHEPAWRKLVICIIAQAVEDYCSGDPTAAAWFVIDDGYKNLLTLLDLPPDFLPAPVASDVGRR